METRRQTRKYSPFHLHPEDSQRLEEEQGFTLLRHYLSQHSSQRSCGAHQRPSKSATQSWSLSRDILHALLVPIVELFNEAVSAAEQSTQASRSEDLEYAFHGSARFAFVWLQSFLERERKWCLTHGCAGCVVKHALDSEFSIRLLFAACLLSDIDCSSAPSGPSLPRLGFFSNYLIAALEADDLWSGEYIEQVQTKAEQLKESIEDLMNQNASLRALLSASSSSDDEDGPSLRKTSLAARSELPRIRVRRGKIARRQRALEKEEAWWIEQSYATIDDRVIAQSIVVSVAS